MNVQTARQGRAPSLMDLAKAGILYFPENAEIRRRLKAKRKRDERKAKKKRARRRERKAVTRALEAANILDDGRRDENAPPAIQSVQSSNDQSLPSTNDSTDDSNPSSDCQIPQQLRSAPEDIPFLDFFPEMAPFWGKSTGSNTVDTSNNKTYDVKRFAVGDDSFAHWLKDIVCSEFTNDDFWDDEDAKPVEGLFDWASISDKKRPVRWNKDDGKDQPQPLGDPPAVVQVMQTFPEFAALWKTSTVGASYGAANNPEAPTEPLAVEVPITESAPDYVPLSTNPTENIFASDQSIFDLEALPTTMYYSDDEMSDDIWVQPCGPVDQQAEFQPPYWAPSAFEIPDNPVLVNLEDLCACCRQKTTEKQATRE